MYQMDSLIRGRIADKTAIISRLKDLKLIEDIHIRLSTCGLTEKGWGFKNFIEYERSQKK